MAFKGFTELGVKITPQLRAFLRSELAQVVHFYGVDGETWNPHKIAAEIRVNPDIPGSASDDTLVRFLSGLMPHQTRKSALEAIAGFLLSFEYISEHDLKTFEHPSYDRAASALADIFKVRSEATQNNKLLGTHRSFRTIGRKRLVETALTLGSLDNGASVSASLSITIYFLDEPEYVLAETEYLHPAQYQWMRDYLLESETEAHMTAPGVAVLTDMTAFAVVGGDKEAIQGILNIGERHWRDDDFAGMRVSLSPRVLDAQNGALVSRDLPQTELILLRQGLSRHALYPQGFDADFLPEFDPDFGPASNGELKGRGLSFQGTADGKMSDKDKFYLQAETEELETEAALARCADETERLALAIDLMRVDHALAAVEAGADINAIHEARKIPMVHAAASLGMRKLVNAMLDRDVNLTVRDRFSRLPSACADYCAGDFELRDQLAAAQASQFREKGIDPRRPTPPEV